MEVFTVWQVSPWLYRIRNCERKKTKKNLVRFTICETQIMNSIQAKRQAKTSHKLPKWKWREASNRKIQVEMEGYCQRWHESLEVQGGIDHWQGEMERSLQDPLPGMGHWQAEMETCLQDQIPPLKEKVAKCDQCKSFKWMRTRRRILTWPSQIREDTLSTKLCTFFHL